MRGVRRVVHVLTWGGRYFLCLFVTFLGRFRNADEPKFEMKIVSFSSEERRIQGEGRARGT